jgi:hypothetical protein
MCLIDGEFCQALANRRHPRLISGIVPFRYANVDLLRRMGGLDLVYRLRFSGIFIWKRSLFKESFFKSSIRDVMYLPPSPGFSGRGDKGDAVDKRGIGMGPGDSYIGQALQEGSPRGFIQKRSLVSPHVFMISIGGSWARSARRADTKPSTKRSMASGPLPGWNPEEGYSLLKPAVTSSYRVAALSRTDGDLPLAIRQSPEIELAHHSNRIYRPIKPALVPSFQNIILPGTKESPPMAIGDRYGFDRSSYSNLSHSSIKPVLISSSQSQTTVPPSTSGILSIMVGHRSKVDISLFSNRDLRPARPVFASSSQAYMLSRADESPAAVMKQKPKVNLSQYIPSRTDCTAAQMDWAKGIVSALHPPAEMEYAAPRHPSIPIEKESGLADARREDGSRPPAINISRLSDRVYSLIERRMKIDRERRGIYA